MGAKTLISESEYLQMAFDGPEAEYVDGEIQERSRPTNSHSLAMLSFCLIFGRFMATAPIFPRPELRMRVGPRRFRVADLAVFAYQAPSAEIPPEVPHVVIEILSPDDRLRDIIVKFAEYRAFGVPHIWLADPALRSLYIYRDGSLTSVPELALPEFDLSIKIAEVFA